MENNWNLTDEIDDFIYISDIDTYDILFMNRYGKQIVNDQDVIGKKCHKLIYDRDTPCEFCPNSKLSKGDYHVWEQYSPNLHKRFLIKDKLIDWDGRLCRFEYACDISDRLISQREHHFDMPVSWCNGDFRNQFLIDIKNKRFKMFLQPKVDLKSGKLIGCEALARYVDDMGDVFVPDHFISVLEKNRLIRYLDFFIFEEACKTLYECEKAGLDKIAIAVNFSRLTFLEEDLVEIMDNIQSQYGCDKSLLTVEITENIGEMNRDYMIAMCNKIKACGYNISLDDFGSKYTNMSLLTYLNFDEVKLDRSIVKDVTSNIKNKMIIRHIIDIGNELGVQIVAEGVETIEQKKELKKLGCHIAQGYLYGKPSDVARFKEQFLQRG